jgi:uncharacterized protein (TIGR02453 family)
VGGFAPHKPRFLKVVKIMNKNKPQLPQNTAVFSPQSLQFLAELKFNNSREWYNENKSTADTTLIQPFRRLNADLAPVILKIDSDMETNPKRTISRLYRDVRFSKDKTLYRDRMWLAYFPQFEDKNNCPSFFFEISPFAYRYGMGFYTNLRLKDEVF